MRQETISGWDLAVQGATRASDAAGEAWKAIAYDALIQYAKTHKQFQCEEVRIFATNEIGLSEPPDNRAWGGIVLRASKAGLIERVGFAPVKFGHARPMPIWQLTPEGETQCNATEISNHHSTHTAGSNFLARATRVIDVVTSIIRAAR